MSSSSQQRAEGRKYNHLQTDAPHYALPNTSSILAPYSNSEQDVILQSFNVGNFRLIKSLPNELKTNHVNEARLNALDANVSSALPIAPHGSYRKIDRFTLFSDFEYLPSEYSLSDRLKVEEQASNAQKTTALHVQPFKVASTFPQELEQTGGRLGFLNKETGQPEVMFDPYEGAEDADRRRARLASDRLLAGPFVPPGATKNRLNGKTTSRAELPDIIQAIGRELDEDWADCEFDVYSDPDDLIMLQFSEASLDSRRGLLAYMNILINTRPVISEYGISKIAELWDHVPGDGFVYYCLKPGWTMRVRMDKKKATTARARNEEKKQPLQ
jgi:hypothetical protein